MQRKKTIILTMIVIIIAVVIGLVYLQFSVFKDNVRLENNANDTATCENIEYKANALKTLKVPTAYDNSQVTHPSLFSFDKEWNGYKYWLAVTPYINGNSIYENPHIVASNNLIDWEKPEGLKNPIDEIQDPSGKDYNSDNHLVYNSDKNELQVFWRTVLDNKVIIYYSTSKDGVKWSDKEVAINVPDRSKRDLFSPAIIYIDGLYRVWYVSRKYDVEYIESKDLKKWSEPRIIKVNYPNKDMRSWHMDVEYNDGQYEMLIASFIYQKPFKTLHRYTGTELYYLTSHNNIDYSNPEKVIGPSNNGFDNKGLYRSTFNKINNEYVVIYAAVSNARKWNIGLSIGPSMEKLVGMGQTCFKYEYDKVVD